VTYQGLYTAAEVGGSGTITTLRFQNMLANAGPITCPNTTIRLGHSNLAALTTTFASNMNLGTPQVVLNNATVDVPAAAGTWFDIALTTPFEYNGFDNLVVQVDRTTVCSGGVIFGVNATTAGAGRRVFSSATDTTPGTAQNNTTTGTTVDTIMPWMRFVFAGGDNKLNFGGVNANFFPFSASTGRRTQHLYLASEINGSGNVTGVAFQTNAITVAGTYSYSLRLGHSTLAALTTTYASNYSGSPTTVANAVANFTIPAGIPAGEWIWVPIPDSVFAYNGTDNLIVDVSVTAGVGDNAVRNLAAVTGRRVYNNSDAAATTGTVDDFAYHIALRFHGGRVVKLSAGTGNNDAIFQNLFSTATLYSATDLGTAGSITSVSCRLFSASTAASYANFKVVMGHATGSTLSGTAATDFVSQNTVFSGSFAVPAGLLAGDWIDIPLSTSFAYDGKRNLIVWMGNGGPGPGTATVNNCRGENNATRYPSGLGLTTAGVGTAGYGVVDWTTEIRMTVQK
jgi:hypothetical protein